MFLKNDQNFKLIKYADDMALVGLMENQDSTGEAFKKKSHIKALESCCSWNKLDINITKTNGAHIFETRF